MWANMCLFPGISLPYMIKVATSNASAGPVLHKWLPSKPCPAVM